MFLFLQLPQKTEKWDSLRMFETNFEMLANYYDKDRKGELKLDE